MFFGTSRSAPGPLYSRLAAGLALLAVAAFLGGCATTQADGTPRPRNPDPFESVNRGVFKFNDALDRYALRPAAPSKLPSRQCPSPSYG